MKRFSPPLAALWMAAMVGGAAGFLLRPAATPRITRSVEHSLEGSGATLKAPFAQGDRSPETRAAPKPSWAALESTNYFSYMQNLRSIGCPEETIQDIVTADVHKLFAQKRAQLHNAGHGQASPEGFATSEPERLAALDAEEVNVLSKLFGYSRQVENRDLESMTGVPEEKWSQFKVTMKAFDTAEKKVLGSLAADNFTQEGLNQLRQLREQRQHALAQILTPAQREEYELHHSETSQNLQSLLAAVEVDRNEFLSIFRLQTTFDERYGTQIESLDEDYLAERAAAQDALNAQIKALLGQERFTRVEQGP